MTQEKLPHRKELCLQSARIIRNYPMVNILQDKGIFNYEDDYLATK